jgi:hypothetical protein
VADRKINRQTDKNIVEELLQSGLQKNLVSTNTNDQCSTNTYTSFVTAKIVFAGKKLMAKSQPCLVKDKKGF